MKACSASECQNEVNAKGYCDKHYRRFKKYESENCAQAHKKYMFG
jgi:hypothetical protein